MSTYGYSNSPSQNDNLDQNNTHILMDDQNTTSQNYGSDYENTNRQKISCIDIKYICIATMSCLVIIGFVFLIGYIIVEYV